MIRLSHLLRHCCEWFRAAWKWLPAHRSAAKCVCDGAVAADSFRGLLNNLLVLMLLTVVTSSFSIAASSSTSTISTSPEMKSNSSSSSLAHGGRLFQSPNWRGSRFSTREDMIEPTDARRRLSGQYLCRWKKEICEQEPINFLLGPDCCSSMCTNIKIDVFNCGMCGRICFYGSVCCNGDCIEIFNNNRNCGACNNVCPRGEMCHYGLCGYSG